MGTEPFPLRVFRSLPGAWKIERTVDSFGGERIATYAGTGTYRFLEDDFLQYREEGTLKTSLCSSCSFREYYFLWDGGWKVFFDRRKTRPFLQPLFDEGSDYPIEARGEHFCDPDRYEALYRFIDPGTYTVTYTVTGPRKNYTVQSVYRFQSS